MFNFTPLLGAQCSSPASQSLLEFEGGVKILIGVGWDESFDVGKLKELERQVPTLSVLLLTHATPSHIGAFAHCCKHVPGFSRIPVYATTPVISLGRALLQDLYASTPLPSSIVPTSSLSEPSHPYRPVENATRILLQPPASEEIAGYFSLIHPLKYSQPHQPLPSPFSPSLNGLTITAYNAGHTLGGTIWHVQHGLESVVYAVDWNQVKENVLAGAAWLGDGSAGGAEVIEQLRKPTALICSSRGATQTALSGGRQRRDEALITLIRTTLENGGTVLIPSDSSARVLELAYMLESTWRTEAIRGDDSNPFKTARLYMASRTSGMTMRFARSMLEWMDESVVKEFEAAGNHLATQGLNAGTAAGRRREEEGKGGVPFDFKYLRLIERQSQLSRALATSTPKVILASDTSLEWGFSKEVLQGIASDPRNLIIMLDNCQNSQRHGVDGKQTLCSLLWKKLEQQAGGNVNADGTTVATGDGKSVELATIQLSPLTGKELPLYQQYLAKQRQLQMTLQGDGGTTLETSADAVDDRSSTTSSSTDESDSEQQGKALNVSTALSHSRHKLGLSDAELGVNIVLRRKETYDFDVRGKKGRDKLFPFVARRKRGDDFGEIIRPEEYLRAEERDDVDGEDMRRSDDKKETTLGQKRKWDDGPTRGSVRGRQISTGSNKRRRPGQRQNDQADQSTTGGDQLADGAGNDNESEESDYEPAEPTIEGPLKVTFKHETVSINLRISFVDFSGLHDKRSLQMLIPLIRPRILILVGGEKDETLSLAAECKKLLAAAGQSEGGSAAVYTPVVGTVVDASVDTSAWIVKLSQPLVKNLHWQNVRGLSVVTVTGHLQMVQADADADYEAVKKKQRLVNGTEKDTQQKANTTTLDRSRETILPILDVVPVSMASATRSAAQPIHVGDLRLADLRKLMQSSGHTAEFRGEGTLQVDGLVVVRKNASGRIELEGAPLPGEPSSREPDGSFYTVKRKIYEGLAVVAGG